MLFLNRVAVFTGGRPALPVPVISLTFWVFVACQNLVTAHPGGEEFQNHLDGVAQPANGRLPVADVGINRDAVGHSVSSELR
jgi:hypothetical protein